SPYRPEQVNNAFKMMAKWDAGAVRGLEALERIHPQATGKGRRYANLFNLRTDDPAGVAAALRDLAALEPKIDPKDPAALIGIRKVLGSLASEDEPAQRADLPGGKSMAVPSPRGPGNAPNITGAVGALRAGASLARQHPEPD